MTCNKYKGKNGSIAFMCNRGESNVSAEKYQRLLDSNKRLLQKVKDLEKITDTCPDCGCNELLCGYPKVCSGDIG